MVLQTFSGVANKTILRVGLYSWCSFRGQHIYYTVIGETQSNGCLSRTWGLHFKNQMGVFDISKTYLRSLVFVDRLSYSLHWMLHLGPHHSWQWIRSLSLVQAFSNGSPWSKSGPHTILCLTPGLALCQLKNTYTYIGQWYSCDPQISIFEPSSDLYGPQGKIIEHPWFSWYNINYY